MLLFYFPLHSETLPGRERGREGRREREGGMEEREREGGKRKEERKERRRKNITRKQRVPHLHNINIHEGP